MGRPFAAPLVMLLLKTCDEVATRREECTAHRVMNVVRMKRSEKENEVRMSKTRKQKKKREKEKEI